MKKNIHPDNYREVVFQDLNNGATYLTRSTAQTSETIAVDGEEYPLVKVHISSASHPFYTGQEKLVDVEGRVDKFKARLAAAESNKPTQKAARKPKIERASSQKIGNLKTSARR
ncbi:MAG TPA: type B 50S ribosomal protein L31 [Candidatus Saccharimonadales bacterium]|nr:type B 50S ribosomal protein L31 [Candidatus Saccharimonadales bacterium]